MYQIDLEKAKMQMSSLIKAALDGEEIVITENEKPILKLVRVSTAEEPNTLDSGEKQRRQAGTARGLISMSDDFDEPLEDFAEYMQ